jgi:hypothetical protein
MRAYEFLSEGIEVTPIDFTKFKTMQQIEDFVNHDKTWLNRLNYFGWRDLNTPPDSFYRNSRFFHGSDQSKWRYTFYDVPAILTKGNPQGLYKGDMDRTRLEFDFQTLKPLIRQETAKFNKIMGLKVFPTVLKNIIDFMKKDKLQIEAEKQYHNTTYYIRFGRWREEEQSKNFITNEMEKGVSCYNASWDTDTKKWTLETDVNPDTITGTLQGLIDGYLEKPTKKIFLVTGDLVGEGSDEEPLLKNVKAVKELKLSDIQIPDIFDDEDLEDMELNRNQ